MSIQLAKKTLELGLKSRCSGTVGLMQVRNLGARQKEEYMPSSLTKLIETKPDKKNQITLDVPDEVLSISGAPVEHLKERLVRIYRTPKNAMQSGTDNVDSWELEFETRKRWENSLMGWSSSGDPLSNMKLKFDSKESAVYYATKNGFEFYIEPQRQEKEKVKSYGFNFSWNKRTRVSTK